MLTALLTLSLHAHAAPPDVADVPDAHFRQVVFSEAPDEKLRMKLIRKAYKASRTLHGGKDWGRVLCFVFAGPPEPGSLEKALRKSKLHGIIREADGCSDPPAEAFIPPAPEAVRRVRLTEPMEPLILRKAFGYLLDGDHGVSGLHIAPERSDRFCLELESDVPDDVLEVLLSTAPVRTTAIEPATDCGDALGITRP